MKNVKENGITLIALVVTIVVLLILAGVSIAMLAGEDGIIRQAQNAKKETIHAEVKEAVIMKYEEYQIELKTAQNAQTFIEFLEDKEYINSEGTVNVKNLTGKKLGLGNGTDNKTDVYKIEMEESYYVLNYYDKDTSVSKLSLWKSISANVAQEDEKEEIVFPEVAGLYQTGTTNLIKSWEELKADEEIIVSEQYKTLYYISEYLDGDLVISDEVENIEYNYPEWVDSTDINLTGIYIPSTMKTISSGAFSGAINLEKVVIPNGVTSIGDSAFSSCYSLTNINIPESVTSIGDSAFSSCYSLTNINIPSSVTSIGGWAFSGCEGLTSITIPESVTSIGNRAFEYCQGLTSITIPESVTSIGIGTFEDCQGLTSITIPNSVISIGNLAFEACSSLTSINIPESVTNIGILAFSGCDSLTSIKVDENNTVYDSRNNCNAIIKTGTNELVVGCKTTVIPESVVRIGEYAFNTCNGLTSINIPESVTSIGNYAFSYCDSLTSIKVDENNTVYDSRDNCNAIINTTTNELVVGCKSTVIPESVVRIGNSAFSGCTSLTSITIPLSVTSIGNYAFSGCNMDLEVIYDGTEEQWNQIDIGSGNNAITKEPEVE